MLRFIAIALFVVVAKVGSAQTPGTMLPPDPMIGAWRLILEKSNYATPAPNSMTIMVSPATSGYAFTVDAIGPDCQAQKWGFTSAFDGSESQVSGNPGIDAVIATSTRNGGIVRYKKAGNVINDNDIDRIGRGQDTHRHHQDPNRARERRHERGRLRTTVASLTSTEVNDWGPSTTLSDLQLHVFELEHPLQVARLRDEEMGGQDLLNHGADAWQRELGLAAAPPFVLEKAVRDRRQDDVALPPVQAPAFEVVETDLVLEFLVLLLDGPALMGEADERAQRGGGRQIHEVVLGTRRGPPIALAQ